MASPTRDLRLVALGVLLLVYTATYWVLDGLRFPLRGDEVHFWPTALRFSHAWLPTLEVLRSYNDLNTPLPFYLWGVLELAFGRGVWLARVVNYLLSLAILWMVLRPRDHQGDSNAIRATIGLLLCPYFLAVSTHAYTDIIAIFFALVGVRLHLSSRPWLAAAFFVLAIASRQYMLAFPVALVVWELSRLWAQRAHGWKHVVAPALAAASIFGWYLLFGGFGPRTAVESQRIVTAEADVLLPRNGLYLLACVGLYYCVPQILLWKEWSGWKKWRTGETVIAGALLLLFLLFPPLQNHNFPIPTMGYLDRALHLAQFNDPARVTVFYLLALVAVLRLRSRGLELTFLMVNVLIMLKAHIAWDKYALPLLVILWYLQSRPRSEASVIREPSNARAADGGSPFSPVAYGR